MNKRFSKESMLKRIGELEEKLELVYNVGMNGIGYVGAANYAERQREAELNLDIAMYGEAEQ